MARNLLAATDGRPTGRLSLLKEPRFWRSTGLLLLANALVLALALVRTPAMTWLLPRAEVGMLGVVASWLPFVQLLALSGMDSAAYHYTAKGQPWAFVANLFFRLRWSLLASLALLAGAGYWLWRGDALLAWMFLITALSYPVTIGMSASAGMLGAQERFKGLFWYRIFESLTDFAGFLPLALSAWWISKVVTFYAANQLATAAMQAGVSFWLAWKVKQSGARPMEPAEHAEMLRYGRHLTALTGITVLQARSDAFLVGALLPLETMADYSIALLVYEQFRRLWNIFLAVRYPPLVRMPLAQRRRRFVLEGGLVWGAFLAAGLAVSLLGHWLIPRLLPPAYSGSLVYMDLLILTSLAGLPGALAETYFRTRQDEKTQYRMRLVSAAVGVAAPALLIMPWGAAGAAAGRLLASLALSLVGVALFIRDPRPPAL